MATTAARMPPKNRKMPPIITRIAITVTPVGLLFFGANVYG